MMSAIEPFIHRKVVVLHHDSTVMQAARAMCDNKIGCVVVADHEGHISGIITDRDLVCGMLAFLPNADMPLSDLMTGAPVVVEEDATLQEVVGLMEAHGIRRVPVIRQGQGETQKCVGIVTLDDLIASKSIDYDHLSRIVQSQIFRRRGTLIQDLQAERSELRSEAHTEQTLGRFFNTIAEKTELNRELAEGISRRILHAVVERMHYTGAAHLIAQLPQKLQDELLDLPAGPNRRITAQTLIQDITSKFGLTEENARETLVRFWTGLEELIDHKELEHLKAQLPDEMRELFTGVRAQDRGAVA